MFSARDRDWGDWVLGDMSDTLRWAAGILGRASDVVCVSIEPPTVQRCLPRVTVLVADALELLRMRRAVVDGEYVAEFIGQPSSHEWEAEVIGLQLRVCAVQGES